MPLASIRTRLGPRRALASCTAWLALVAVGCVGGETSSPGGPDPTDAVSLPGTDAGRGMDAGDNPDAVVTDDVGAACHSYEMSVQPIFDAHCVGCHSGDPPDELNLAKGMSLDSLMDTVSKADPALSFVVPGDASSSYLVEKMNPGPAYGWKMPIIGPRDMGEPLPDRYIIADWIDAGATLEPWGCR